jgi:Family of unknown function (DUF5343)
MALSYLRSGTHMLTKRYLLSTKNLNDILNKIVEGVAPPKFTTEHLKSLGFASSSDRSIIPLLKDLGFLAADGTPTARYQDYRNRSRSKAVMAEALRDAYEDVFHIREVPTPADRDAVKGLFKSKHNSTDRVAELQAMTFFALLPMADLKAKPSGPKVPDSIKREVADGETGDGAKGGDQPPPSLRQLTTELHYTIQVHLPATKEIEVYNAIFRSLRENLLS